MDDLFQRLGQTARVLREELLLGLAADLAPEDAPFAAGYRDAASRLLEIEREATTGRATTRLLELLIGLTDLLPSWSVAAYEFTGVARDVCLRAAGHSEEEKHS